MGGIKRLIKDRKFVKKKLKKENSTQSRSCSILSDATKVLKKTHLADKGQTGSRESELRGGESQNNRAEMERGTLEGADNDRGQEGNAR